MACLDNETATAYLRGDLDPDDADRWAAHLAECEACRELVQQVSALIDSVRQDLMLAHTQPFRVDWHRVEEVICRPQPDRRWRLLPVAGPRPRYVSAGLAVVASVMLIVVLWRDTPVSAAEALQRAAAAEQAIANNVSEIVHRTLTVEERGSNAPSTVKRQRVEIWQNAAQRTKVRRLYDDGGRLVAGEWTRGDGSRAVYRRDGPPEMERADAPVPLDAENVWRWEPSTGPFLRNARPEDLSIERRTDNSYVLVVDGPVSNAPQIVSATLTLVERDFRPVAQTFMLGSGTDRREFSLIERAWETVLPDRVDAARFVPDRELLPAEAPVAGAAPLAKPPVPVVPLVSPRADSDRLDRVEMQAWYRLHGLGLTLGPQALVERTASGDVRVEVTVSSELRRMAVAQRLESTASDGRIHVAVRVAPDTSPTGVSANAWADNPTYQRLRAQAASTLRISANSAEAEQATDAVARETVQWIRQESDRIVARVAALSRFSADWPPERLRRLDLDALAEWQTIIRDHAVDAGQRAESVRQRCEAAFGAPASSVPPQTPDSLTGPADVERLIRRLPQLADRQASIVTRALPAPETGAATEPSVLDLDAFRAVLIEIEAIATTFAGPWPLGR